MQHYISSSILPGPLNFLLNYKNIVLTMVSGGFLLKMLYSHLFLMFIVFG